MLPHLRSIALALALVAGGAAHVHAQEAAPAARPRIGLVLSGGGARGIAHVGVLEALERERVPVDVVVGTSMGAIVGGLYASGVTSGELNEWLDGVDWGDLFQDDPVYRDLTQRRKRLAREFPVGIELGIGRGGLQVPSGLISGQKLNRELRRLTFPVATIESFDSLPIPFRAVATDLGSGEPLVLTGGDLVGALRASMSVPGVFTPWLHGERLLADGGLRRNVPVELARQLGADIVIVVDVSTPLDSIGGLRSVIDMTDQMTRIATHVGSVEELATLGERDILIRPDLTRVSAAAFDRAFDAVTAGFAAADAQTSRLRELAVSESEYADWRARVEARRRPPDVADFVMVGVSSARPGEALRAEAWRPMLRRLHTRPGAPLDTAVLRDDMADIFAMGIYELVDYRIVPADEGDLLFVEAREKPWGPNYLRFRLSISDDFSGAGAYSFAAHLLVPELNALGGELTLQGQIGDTRYLRAAWWQPVEYSRTLFVEPYVEYYRLNADQYEDERRLAQYRVVARAGGLAGGLVFGRWAELRAGIERGDAETALQIGPDTLTGSRLELGGVYAILEADNLDDPLIPRDGFGFHARFEQQIDALGADFAYRRLNIDYLNAHRLGRRHSAMFGFNVSTGLDGMLPLFARPPLGGLLILSGYRPGEVTGNHMMFSRVMLLRDLTGPDVVLGLSVEAADAWDRTEDIALDDPHFATSLAIGIRSPLGPVYSGIGVGEGGRKRFYLIVGRAL